MTLFVSPHLDDVALSCSARIIFLHGEGARPGIATIFSSGNEEAAAYYEVRGAEELKACQDLGADPILCGFRDAPYRSAKYSSFGRILWANLVDEEETIDSVAAYLMNVVKERSATEICAPLGVGWHIDHLITHEACVRASLSLGIPVSFYEDRPYVFVEGSVEVRLLETGIAKSTPISQPRFLQSLFTMPWMQKFNQAPMEKQAIIDRVKYWWPQALSENSDLAPIQELFGSTSLDESWDILRNYDSQLRNLFPHRKYYSDVTAKYSAQLNGSKGYVERYWR